MKIQESAENYLETILVLHKRKGIVRSIDIANEMGFSKPSVSVAMKNLRLGGYIRVDDDGNITLLDKGREIAEKIYERHTLVSSWLTAMGVDPDIAAEDACRIEHVISNETFDALKRHVSTMTEMLKVNSSQEKLPDCEIREFFLPSPTDRGAHKENKKQLRRRFLSRLFQARALPSASQAAWASSSGASAQMTLPQTSSAPKPLATASQLRIHSPSPQP